MIGGLTFFWTHCIYCDLMVIYCCYLRYSTMRIPAKNNFNFWKEVMARHVAVCSGQMEQSYPTKGSQADCSDYFRNVLEWARWCHYADYVNDWIYTDLLLTSDLTHFVAVLLTGSLSHVLKLIRRRVTQIISQLHWWLIRGRQWRGWCGGRNRNRPAEF